MPAPTRLRLPSLLLILALCLGQWALAVHYHDNDGDADGTQCHLCVQGQHQQAVLPGGFMPALPTVELAADSPVPLSGFVSSDCAAFLSRAPPRQLV